MTNNKLFFFTSTFPYGQKETYIEDEIEFLSNQFEKIEIFPYYYDSLSTKIRSVPKNVIVHPPALPFSKIKRIIGIIYVYKIFRIFIKDFFVHKVFNSRFKLANWFRSLIYTSYVTNSRYFKKNIDIDNVVLYFYWGLGWANCIPFLKKKKCNIRLLRLHGGDCFIERTNGYLPLREHIYNNVDLFLPISEKVKHYLINKYHIQPSIIYISRLGTINHKSVILKKNGPQFIIVSCSNVISLKRIELIISELSAIQEFEITWHHFGDGPLFDIIKELSNKMPSNITPVFHGRILKQDIFDFYMNTYVDVFINLSTHEGLPVSIMEAMSFSIPAIATNVGATAEIVTSENGFLIDVDFIKNYVASIIRQIYLNPCSKRDKAFETWRQLYNADNVFDKHILKSINYLKK